MIDLKKKIEEKGKTSYWLAKQLGVSRQRMHQIQKQKDIYLSLAIRIADVLEMSLDEFRKEV